MISPNDISNAYARICPHVRRTPTFEVEAGGLCASPVTLKLEHLQHTGSFKCRGAFNTLLSKTVPETGVVAVSGGNHGAAVAYAATKLGHHSTVFVPDYAGDVKMDRMRGFGADVIASGNDFTSIVEKYETFAKETGALPVHPFDAPEVLTGQGTVALELEQQCSHLDTLFVSVGGGGLIGGISTWFGDRVNVIAVESAGTATYATAIEQGQDTAIQADGIAANSLGAPRLGSLAFTELKAAKRASVVVTDEQIIDAQRKLWDAARVVGEPGAATALAALTSGVYEPAKGERVGVLICGGNAAPDWFL